MELITVMLTDKSSTGYQASCVGGGDLRFVGDGPSRYSQT